MVGGGGFGIGLAGEEVCVFEEFAGGGGGGVRGVEVVAELVAGFAVGEADFGGGGSVLGGGGGGGEGEEGHAEGGGGGSRAGSGGHGGGLLGDVEPGLDRSDEESPCGIQRVAEAGAFGGGGVRVDGDGFRGPDEVLGLVEPGVGEVDAGLL